MYLNKRVRYLICRLHRTQRYKIFYSYKCILYSIKKIYTYVFDILLRIMLYMNNNIRYRLIHSNKNLFISKSDIFFSIWDIVLYIRYFN